LAALAGIIREVGVASTVLSTDLGQANQPAPVDGMCRYIEGLRELGFNEGDIDRMARANPASLLGL
jgi:predicted metal-dependent phosphotriesterase family hydrolase